MGCCGKKGCCKRNSCDRTKGRPQSGPTGKMSELRKNKPNSNLKQK